MDDRRRTLLGDPGGEPVVHLVDERQLARVLLLPLSVPAVQLAGDVVLLLRQPAEPDAVGVHVVDRDQGVDDPLADRPAVGGLGKRVDLGLERRIGPSTQPMT